MVRVEIEVQECWFLFDICQFGLCENSFAWHQDFPHFWNLKPTVIFTAVCAWQLMIDINPQACGIETAIPAWAKTGCLLSIINS
jgi:hypothetical protein